MMHTNLNATFSCLEPRSKSSSFYSYYDLPAATADDTAEILQATIEELPDAVCVCDENGRILATSRMLRDFSRLTGLKGITDAEEKDYFSLFCNPSEKISTPATAARKIRNLLCSKSRRIQFDYEINDRNRRYHLRLTASRQIISGQERIVAIHHDITPCVRMAEERQAWAARLLDVQLNERQRIARELHDSTAQHLAAISLSLERLPQLNGDPLASAVFRDIHNVVDEAQREIRAISFLLHPPVLAEGGLCLALDRLFTGFSERTSLPIHFEARLRDIELSADSEIALFRVGQEALTNIHKHARATAVIVRLYRSAGQVVLEIEDDGIGVNQQTLTTGNPLLGVGIPGMKARLAQLSGQLMISKLAKGTRVKATAPIRPRPR